MLRALALTTILATASAVRAEPTELVYPRPGRPALLEPGAMLVAHVRVPAPLMPAPGIQQPRALQGWSAELLGHSTPIDAGAEHRYALRVLDVRADAASGLVFRATVRVPPWAAPGTYTFRIGSPGSAFAAASGAVRVLVPGRAPVVARHSAAPQHASWDVDVWLADDVLPDALVGAGVPWIDPSADEHAALAQLVVEPTRRVTSLAFLETETRVELEGATWYPGTDVRPIGMRASLIARVEGVEPTEVARGAVCPPALALEAPEATIVDEPFALSADATQVGWAFEEDGARWEPSPTIRLRWIGVQEVHALAVEGGCARRGQVAVSVEPALRMGCAASRGQPSGILWFFALLCTIGARRYKPRRNLLTREARPTSRL